MKQGKSPNKGKGIAREKFQKPIEEAGKYNSQIEKGRSSRGENYGGRIYFPI
jgi:hypothetical protein